MLLTLFIPAFIAFCILWKLKSDTTQKYLMSKDHTTAIKGLCAIIVVMVHFPEEYQNPLQDAIGSFAYVAVTFFFLFSSYGMEVSLQHKSSYLNNFWTNRLPALLVPIVFINVASYLIYLAIGGNPTIKDLFSINNYVVVLLTYCIAFYIVMQINRRTGNHHTHMAISVLIALVIMSSLLLYFFTFNDKTNTHGIDWCYERIGLVWGLLIFMYFTPIMRWFNSNTVKKIVLSTIICIVAGCLYLKFKSVFFWGEYVLKIALGLVIITFAMLLSAKYRIMNPCVKFLGNISYEIYLSHWFVMQCLTELIPGVSSGVFIILTLILTIDFSYAISLMARPTVAMIKSRYADRCTA